MRHLSVLTAAWVLLVALLASGTAVAQEDETEDDEVAAEPVYYGDVELIDALRTYGLLDEWIDASPISPQASLLDVHGSGGYQAQRQTFLNSLEAWADRTEQVRTDLARIDSAQANADTLRSVITQVRDALLLDDRLAYDSTTLIEIGDALGQLAAVQLPDNPAEPADDSLVLAEAQLNVLWDRAASELQALNGTEAAVTRSGVESFVGFEDLRLALLEVDQLLVRARNLIRPAREDSERLVSSALAQIPNLHAARMLGSSDVGELSVVTVDAYIRAAARSTCSVDWALLAGIGKIESNHARMSGASVSRSGQVSTTILGPLLDGGETEREADETGEVGDQLTAAAEAIETARQTARTAFANSMWSLLRGYDDINGVDEEPGDHGNGFAVVLDTDDGRLDGNEQWDRAVGPMQFLPETWARWATDGNNDGVSDPHNLYDAAASAARFLCHLSATRGSSPSTFVLGYNSSSAYVRSVLATAAGLRAKSLPGVS